MDRVISVEYAAHEDGDPPIRGGRGLSPSRNGGGRGGATRGSPDYSRGRSPPRGGGRNHR
jgi:arginine/serine-rich splicing factor 4/5/6